MSTLNENLNKVPYYSSWKAIILFIIIIILQPREATFFAIRPSDIWLLFCLFLQVKNGFNSHINISCRLLIKYYGFFIGILAIIATIVQASYNRISLDISFLFQFYFFLRFLLIYKFVENILSIAKIEDELKLWKSYTFLGIFILILSFLEFYDIGSFKLIMMGLYYSRPEDTVEEYLVQADRLAGVMGNPNTTAIFMLTTLTYPLLRIINSSDKIIKTLFFLIYVIAVVYSLIVLSGSRTAIFILLVIVLFAFIVAFRRLKYFLTFLFLTLLLVGIGFYFSNHLQFEVSVQDRIKEMINPQNNVEISVKGLGKWSGRYELWKNRLDTFHNKGNPLAAIIGMGYTKAYTDYADNGFLTTLINNGMIGFFLKLTLYYLFITAGLYRAFRYFFMSKLDYSSLAFGLNALALLIMELTIDITDHYRLGQLFFLLLSATMILNIKAFSVRTDFD